MLLEVSPFVARLTIINISKLATIYWSRCGKTFDIHRPEHGKVTGCYQCLAHWHVIGAPFRNAGFDVNYAQQSFCAANAIQSQYVSFVRDNARIINAAQEHGFFGFAAYPDVYSMADEKWLVMPYQDSLQSPSAGSFPTLFQIEPGAGVGMVGTVAVGSID